MRRKGRIETLGKKPKIVIGVAIGVVVGLFIGVPIVLSFVAPGTVLKADANNNDITGVTQFFVVKDGSLYNIRFSLVNKDSAAVPSDANITFVAKTRSGDDDDVLYSRDFSIKSQDFQRYRFVTTGFPMVAYAWQLNVTDLDKYPSGDFPTAYLSVTLPNGRMFNASTSYF
jgi:hypothetical protein